MSLEGSWDVTFTTTVGKTTETWSFVPDGEGLRVHGKAETGEVVDEPLTVDGDAFSFTLAIPNMPLKATISGQRDGDTLSGAGKLAAMQFGTFEATRSS